MMVLFKAGFMSLCHSLDEGMELWWPGNNAIMMYMGGIAHTLSNYLLFFFNS